MPGKMNKLNEYPKVVLNPTRYTGGKNTYPVVVLKPTEFKGGGNDPSKFTVNPKK